MKKSTILGIIIFLLIIGTTYFVINNSSEAEPVSSQNYTEAKAVTGRGCYLDYASNFMISDNQAATFVVTNNNIDSAHPPDFIFKPTFTDWKNYHCLKFKLLVLPSSLATKAKILIQLASLSDKGQNKAFLPEIPVGVPVTINIPLNQVQFRKEIGTIIFGACNTPGTYLISQMEVSSRNINDITIEPFQLSQTDFTPEDSTITPLQENGFWEENTYCYNSNKPFFLDINLVKPAQETEKKKVQFISNQGKVMGENNIIFNKGDITKKILFTPNGNTNFNINIDNIPKTVSIRDVNNLTEENLKIREQRKQAGNPFYRGIISAYAGSALIYDKVQNTIDVDATIARLKDLGVNCYTYLIGKHSEAELAALPEFCEKAAKAGIEVWVYMGPPSEAPIGRDRPIEERKYPPFDLNYEKWAEAIANISLEHPNLTLWMIDDFDSNSNFFTVNYTKQIYEDVKGINPKLLFGICVYHQNLKNFVDSGYLPYFDAVLWGYQSTSSIYPDCGINPESLPMEINDYYKICPNKIIIPCLYFTAHSSWPKDRPNQKYLEDAIKIAFEQAGIAWIFTTPDPNTWKYDIVKNYSHSVNLKF